MGKRLTRPEPGSRWRHSVAGWVAVVTNGFTYSGLDLVAFKPPRRVSRHEIALNRSLFLADFVKCEALPLARKDNPPMEFHPIANLFPLFDNDQLDELAEDIGKHGLREPIVTLDGKVLDGRNRWRACMEIGYPPEYRAFDPEKHGEPLAYVISHNLRRRHLSESQRAMVAAKLSTFGHGGDRTEQAANLPDEKPVTVAGAAELLSVSERSVQTARKVLADGVTELADAVDAGGVSVSAAGEVATLPPEQQHAAAAAGGEAVKQKAAQTRGARLTGDYEWMSPENIVQSARIVMSGIDLDPASSHEANDRVGASRYFTKAEDGLNQGEWVGRIWLNPPYSNTLVRDFVHNLVVDHNSGKVTQAVALLPSGTDTGWYHEIMEAAGAVCFPLGRLKFDHQTKKDTRTAPNPSTLFYLGPEVTRFVLEFDKHGICWSR